MNIASARSSEDVASSSPLQAFVICYIITLLGIVMVLLPFLFEGVEETLGDGAFAMVLLGGFLALTAFFVSAAPGA